MAGAGASLLGQVISGRYRLTERLGEGGMGEVYAAEHVHITKRVAVKVLHPEVGANPEALARFRQEAQSASSIGHPNIVSIDDFGQMEDGRFYLCMEYLVGQSMAELMQAEGGLAPGRALALIAQVCDGLAAAHAKGIIHRDMKPENVFVTQGSDGSDCVKVLDFGIAKVSQEDGQSNLTKTGSVFGTPHYMSPEQALGKKVDARADIYSLGVILFEVFTGQLPFKAESFMGILSQHITEKPPLPSQVAAGGKGIPEPVEGLILRAMAKDPSERFASVLLLKQAMLQVFEQLYSGAAGATVWGMPRSAAAAEGNAPGASGPSGTLAATPLAATPPTASAGRSVGSPPPPTVAAGAAVAALPATRIAGPDSSHSPALPTFSAQPRDRPSKKGPYIALAGGAVLVAVLATAAALNWDRIVGNPTGQSPQAGIVKTSAQTDATLGSTSSAVDATPMLDATQVAARSVDAMLAPDSGKRVQGKPMRAKKQRDRRPRRPRASGGNDPRDPKMKASTTPRLPAHYNVKLVSIPGKAAILRDGRRIGRTPKVFRLRAGENVEIVLAKAGWRDKRVTVRAGDGPDSDVVQRERLVRGVGPGRLGIPNNDPF